ncbi:MAG: hypothetical protein HZA60_09985 [Deltaproteobacteria bacterium]|nr:hypothetical protein [Deltaproteobacteria bacterium]
MAAGSKRPPPDFQDEEKGLPEEEALLCLVLLLEGLVRVHPDRESWAFGENLTGNYLEAAYRLPRMRFIHLLRRSAEHAENVRTSLEAEGCGASFTDDPEAMVTVLSADVSRAEFAPHVREALLCYVFHMKVLAENVILSEDTWSLARLNAAKAAPRYGISRERFRPLLDGAMETIERLRESNPFSAIY